MYAFTLLLVLPATIVAARLPSLTNIAFTVFDHNGDGKISIAEYDAYFRGLSTMAMISTDLVVFLVCWVLPLLVSATGLTKYTHDFLALANGDFNNQKQVEEPGNTNAFIQYRLIPVDAPGLGPGPVIYEEWAAKGVVLDMIILLVSERPGPSIHVDIYNFSYAGYLKPGEFNVSKLRGYTRKDLIGGNCTAIYKKLAKSSVYVGSYPDCSYRIKGNYPPIGDTFICNAYSAVVPPTSPNFSTTPFILNRIGNRYPLIGFPDNYNAICGPKKTSH